MILDKVLEFGPIPTRNMGHIQRSLGRKTIRPSKGMRNR